jgi:hypothetical protein
MQRINDAFREGRDLPSPVTADRVHSFSQRDQWQVLYFEVALDAASRITSATFTG